MHKKDVQDLSTQFLMASIFTISHKVKSKCSVLNKNKDLAAQLDGMLLFSSKIQQDWMFPIIVFTQEKLRR